MWKVCTYVCMYVRTYPDLQLPVYTLEEWHVTFVVMVLLTVALKLMFSLGTMATMAKWVVSPKWVVSCWTSGTIILEVIHLKQVWHVYPIQCSLTKVGMYTCECVLSFGPHCDSLLACFYCSLLFPLVVLQHCSGVAVASSAIPVLTTSYLFGHSCWTHLSEYVMGALTKWTAIFLRARRRGLLTDRSEQTHT